jgi:hypothetical protein
LVADFDIFFEAGSINTGFAGLGSPGGQVPEIRFSQFHDAIVKPALDVIPRAGQVLIYDSVNMLMDGRVDAFL